MPILPTLKGLGSRTDARSVDLSPELANYAVWFIVAAAVLGMLGTLSSAIAQELMIQDVHLRAERLKAQYHKRLAEERNAIEVDEAPAA